MQKIKTRIHSHTNEAQIEPGTLRLPVQPLFTNGKIQNVLDKINTIIILLFALPTGLAQSPDHNYPAHMDENGSD